MSNIEWTEETWQVTSGCTMVSPGCARCYAETMAKRLKGMAQADIAAGRDPGRKRSYLNVIGDKGKWNDKIELLPNSLTIPLKRKKPTTWFVNSMSDLFHEGVPFDYVRKVWRVMCQCQQHTFQILTKRPERMAEFLAKESEVPAMTGMTYGVDYLPKNVWLGTSVEDQKRADERIPHLLRCPAAVRFLSCEPLLGPIDLLHLTDGPDDGSGWTYRHWNALEASNWCDCQDFIHPIGTNPVTWVIVGGESGPGARPMNVEWARSIVRQCKEAGVACFVKQMGAYIQWNGCQGGYMDGPSNCWPEGTKRYDDGGCFRVVLKDSKGGAMDEWPEDLRVRQMPAMAGGNP